MNVTLLSFKCMTFDKCVTSFSKDFKPLLSDADKKKAKTVCKSHLQYSHTFSNLAYAHGSGCGYSLAMSISKVGESV